VKRPADAQQISLLPPDAAELLHLVRQNLRLLAELVDRYEVGRLGVGTGDQVLRSPADVAGYLGAELADLAQEQLPRFSPKAPRCDYWGRAAGARGTRPVRRDALAGSGSGSRQRP
jgi:hypothetical protein